MKVLVAGAPGAGKGTQVGRLAHELRVPHIASGDIVRDHIERATEEGVAARQATERGDLVSDEVLLRMLRPALEEAAGRGGFVLDGFPRTIAQAEHVETTSAALDVVVHLVVPRDELVDRLVSRGRQDDTPDVVAHRLDVYDEQTAPLLARYADSGRLVTVDGTGDVDDVAARVVREVRAWRQPAG